VSKISDIAMEIALVGMEDCKPPTAVEEHIYLDAVKILRGELRKLKKRMVAEVNQEHEKGTPDDNEGKQEKGSPQKKTQPNPSIMLASPCLRLPAFTLRRFEKRRRPRFRPTAHPRHVRQRE
jgi:hypothetical protein